MGVADGETADVVLPRACLDDRVRRHTPRFQGCRHRDRLHGRARLEHVGDRAVAQLLTTEVLTLFWLVARVIGQRQHLARDRIQDHDAAGFGLVDLNRIPQLLVRKELDLAVDAELQVTSVDRRHLFADVLDHSAQAILDHAAGPGAPGQLLVESQLDALLPDVFHVGEAHDVRCRLTFRILALVFATLVDALDAQLGDLLGNGLVDLALEPYKGLVLVFDLLVQFCQGHGQQSGQLLELVLVAVDVLGNRPDALRHDAGGQDQAIAVKDASAIGRQFQRARKPDFTLALEKSVAEHLDVGGATGQPHEPQGNGRHNEFAAPDRRLAGQQGAGRVEHALAHRTASLAWGAGKATYWVMAGVVVRMRN
ncbi:MAG: hypothetical protein BWX79_01276 [Alphaproteobacteria bacterium ADurb.Bin100]|nr:MAG: hypothetical protein BWX79_01276 [Alphaproteobacteria bacterium ADurb.Bin100]